ncbi:MAG: GNAT family N-acetyltransferase [Alphaproteobacteria bacterium]
MDKLVFRDLDTSTWDDLETLFSAPGGPKHCWCMVWRPKPRGASKMGKEIRRTWLHAFVERGVPIGLLGYADDAPVAWCSIGPRAEHRRLGGPEDLQDEINAVWSLTCFYIQRSHRRTGRVSELIGAAVDYARRGGAVLVEAYPVEPDAPSYRFMGFTPVFTRAGFTEVGTAGFRRHVMRLHLR